MPLTNPNTTALQKANDLSDLANAANAWLNLGGSQSLAANSGWIKLPNGLILQWQTLSVSPRSFTANTLYNFNITFPITFNTVYSCVGCQTFANVGAYCLTFEGLTTSKVTAVLLYANNTLANPSFRVFAIGI